MPGAGFLADLSFPPTGMTWGHSALHVLSRRPAYVYCHRNWRGVRAIKANCASAF